MKIEDLLTNLVAIEWLKFGHEPAHKVNKVQIMNSMGIETMKKIKEAILTNTLANQMFLVHNVIDSFSDIMLIAHYPNHQDFANGCGARPFVSDTPITLLRLYLHKYPETIINYCREECVDTNSNSIVVLELEECLHLEAIQSMAQLKELYLNDIGITEEKFEDIISSESDLFQDDN